MLYDMYIHTPALVLNSEPWLERDRLVTLYTLEAGKVRAIVKGARGVLSKINPHLQVGRQVKVVLARGKEWWRLTAAELPTRSRVTVVTDFAEHWAWLSWYRFLGRVLKEEVAEMEVWEILREFQDYWEQALPVQRQLLYLAITIRLLGALGYTPRWQCCANCQAEVKGVESLFYSWGSGAICARCPRDQGMAVSLPVAKLCRYFSETSVRTWWGKTLALPLRQELNSFLDRFLQYHFAEAYDIKLFTE